MTPPPHTYTKFLSMALPILPSLLYEKPRVSKINQSINCFIFATYRYIILVNIVTATVLTREKTSI